MTETIESDPMFSHYCVECKKPVSRPKASREERGSMQRYGSSTLCDPDKSRNCRERKKARELRPPKYKGPHLQHEHNVLGLQHYMERRRERLARKCRISM